jgi:hypothetical protein
VELEWIPWLGLDVYTNNLESCHRVTHSGPASAAKQIEQARPNTAPKRDARIGVVLVLQCHRGAHPLALSLGR